MEYLWFMMPFDDYIFGSTCTEFFSSQKFTVIAEHLYERNCKTKLNFDVIWIRLEN